MRAKFRFVNLSICMLHSSAETQVSRGIRNFPTQLVQLNSKNFRCCYWDLRATLCVHVMEVPVFHKKFQFHLMSTEQNCFSQLICWRDLELDWPRNLLLPRCTNRCSTLWPVSEIHKWNVSPVLYGISSNYEIQDL